MFVVLTQFHTLRFNLFPHFSSCSFYWQVSFILTENACFPEGTEVEKETEDASLCEDYHSMWSPAVSGTWRIMYILGEM